jgi:hypothetical protein
MVPLSARNDSINDSEVSSAWGWVKRSCLEAVMGYWCSLQVKRKGRSVRPAEVALALSSLGRSNDEEGRKKKRSWAPETESTISSFVLVCVSSDVCRD